MNTSRPLIPSVPIAWLAFSLLTLFWCGEKSRGQEGLASQGAEYFETHIRPLFARYCYECHSSRAKETQGGLRLDTRTGWMEGGHSGASVIPGDPDASALIRAIRYTDPELQMPPVAPLSPEAISKIEHWIRLGAPGPMDGLAVDSASPSDPIAGKSHWAFQPLNQHTPAIPQSDPRSDWPRSVIDQYVAAQWASHGLHAVADADSIAIVRRLFFQLVGLPPSQSDIDAFLSEDSEEALPRMVDRLLASPEFGRRWGRHWLDLARYADSNGLDENFLFREAWRYRNWVIDAINRDMPFDRFAMEQLAGDLLPFETIEQRDQQRIAAGFLVIGPKVLLGNNPKNQRLEVADEQLDTIGKTFLGQTLGCARCHDHKFDPVPTADYYALAGILSSTDVMESRYMLGEQRVMERLVGLGANGNELDETYETFWKQHPKRTAQKKDADAVLEALKEESDDKKAEFASLLEKTPTAIAEAAKDLSKSREERYLGQEMFVKELAQVLSAPPAIPPRAMIPSDASHPSDEPIRLAGQFDRPGEQVPRGFLTVLMDQPVEIPSNTSGRLELSQWLVDSNHRAGQLVARVQANRVWYHLMGTGLVRTVDNFGRTGEPAINPALLDHLADTLIRSNWSLKALVREIVLSRTFRLSCQVDATNATIDPDNRLYWRANRRRLDPESFRDAMLNAADRLDLRTMESTVFYLGDQATAVGDNKVRRRVDFPCRSVYLPVIRNDLPELFNVFDFANPHQTTGARPKTIVPMQSLFALNDETVMDAAQFVAKRILWEVPSTDQAARVVRMFDIVLNSKPNEVDQQSIQLFLKRTEQRLTAENAEEPELKTWTMVCHALFASSRFQFLE